MSLPKIIFSFAIVLLIIFLIPKYSYAAFNGGINIGDHYSEINQAVTTVGNNGWIYVLINPSDDAAINRFKTWLTTYPNINFVLRGHYPNRSLATEDAQKWGQVLANLPRPIYFVPVNEPNNPAESGSGIPAQTVVSYINALKTAGLFNNNPNVRVLSPAIDVYSMADRPEYSDPSNYARQLNDLSPNFFSQFYGLALNLYGEYLNGELNVSAHDVKKGDYKQFISEHLGITGSPRIFVVETGVKKVEDQGVRYAENRLEIIKYFTAMKQLWGNDANVNMFAIFSYDPDSQYNPNASTWIYTDTEVMNSMNLQASSDQTEPTLAPPTEGDTNPVIDMYNVTKRSNSRLLPQLIQEAIRATNCVGGIKIGRVCLFGDSKIISYQNITTGDLAGETENFQPIYIPSNKVEKAARNCGLDNCVLSDAIFGNVIAPQMSDKLSGSLNAYCPSGLNCNQQVEQTPDDSSVLAGETSKPQEVVNSYNFTMKMLLPASIGGAYADIPAIESPTPIPTSTPVPTVSITPSISPFTTPTPSVSPPPSDIATLKDPDGSPQLKQLIAQASDHFKVPQAVIAAVSWIEGAHIWYYDDAKVNQYIQPGAQDPKNCSENPWTAAGPMQFTRGQWEPPPPAYKEAVKEAPGQQDRVGDRCNLMDSFWGAAKKLKDDSSTGNNSSLNWDKAAVANAGYHYYGLCGRCPLSSGDPELNLGGTDIFACIRFRGKSYCEYMWDYYQCNDKSAKTEDFISCAKSKGLETGVRKFAP